MDIWSHARYYLNDRKERVFYITLLQRMRKWIFYNPRRLKIWTKQKNQINQYQNNTNSLKFMLCVWLNQRGVVYCEVLKPLETITGNRYWLQLIRLYWALKENGQNLTTGVTSWFCYMTTPDLTLQNWFRHTWKGWNEIFRLTHHIHHIFLLEISICFCHAVSPFGRTTFTWKYQKWLDKWIGSKEPEYFLRNICLLPEIWEKVIIFDGKWFEWNHFVCYYIKGELCLKKRQELIPIPITSTLGFLLQYFFLWKKHWRVELGKLMFFLMLHLIINKDVQNKPTITSITIVYYSFSQTKIWKDKYKLKGTNIFIDDDLTEEEMIRQSGIRRTAKIKRGNGQEVRVGYNKSK